MQNEVPKSGYAAIGVDSTFRCFQGERSGERGKTPPGGAGGLLICSSFFLSFFGTSFFLIFAIRKSQKMTNDIFWRRPGLNLHRGRPLYKCTEAGALCKFHRGPSLGSVPAAHVTSAGAGAALHDFVYHVWYK